MYILTPSTFLHRVQLEVVRLPVHCGVDAVTSFGDHQPRVHARQRHSDSPYDFHILNSSPISHIWFAIRARDVSLGVSLAYHDGRTPSWLVNMCRCLCRSPSNPNKSNGQCTCLLRDDAVQTYTGNRCIGWFQLRVVCPNARSQARLVQMPSKEVVLF